PIESTPTDKARTCPPPFPATTASSCSRARRLPATWASRWPRSAAGQTPGTSAATERPAGSDGSPANSWTPSSPPCAARVVQDAAAQTAPAIAAAGPQGSAEVPALPASSARQPAELLAQPAVEGGAGQLHDRAYVVDEPGVDRLSRRDLPRRAPVDGDVQGLPRAVVNREPVPRRHHQRSGGQRM